MLRPNRKERGREGGVSCKVSRKEKGEKSEDGVRVNYITMAKGRRIKIKTNGEDDNDGRCD